MWRADACIIWFGRRTHTRQSPLPFSKTQTKTQANTNVVYWGGRLLALWEGGLPHLMDPITLQTIGESRLNKVLKPGQNLCAHPRYDPATNRHVFFSTDPDPRSTKLTLYEFDDQFRCVFTYCGQPYHGNGWMDGWVDGQPRIYVWRA